MYIHIDYQSSKNTMILWKLCVTSYLSYVLAIIHPHHSMYNHHIHENRQANHKTPNAWANAQLDILFNSSSTSTSTSTLHLLLTINDARSFVSPQCSHVPSFGRVFLAYKCIPFKHLNYKCIGRDESGTWPQHRDMCDQRAATIALLEI